MTDAPDQIEAWANYNGDIDGHWVSTTPPEIATPTVLDPPSFSTSYTRTDLYDAVVAERDRMREALHNLTSASNSMVIGIGIHNQIAERRDEHLIKGPVVTVFANACHEAHAALKGSE